MAAGLRTGGEMIVAAALVAFLAVVILLSVLGARRTGGRACCAPADPADDLRMRSASTVKLEGE
jgi:hypothetical protein